ncbi:hypothetical protein PG995_011805 [Apiospora arundinis]
MASSYGRLSIVSDDDLLPISQNRPSSSHDNYSLSEDPPAHHGTSESLSSATDVAWLEPLREDESFNEAIKTPFAPYVPDTGLRRSKSSSPLKRFKLGDWLWEIGASTFSLACTIGLVALLFTIQDKSLSSWHARIRISPNTVVSILSGLSKASLLVPVAACISQLKWVHFKQSPRPLGQMDTFDVASRGPWGALTLLWHLKLEAKLASWASLITILVLFESEKRLTDSLYIRALAMEPFTQQIISFRTRPVYIPGRATYSVAHTYDSGASRGITATWQRKMDPRMQGAILNGLYSLGSPVKYDCPTGNCQWPDFSTLAIAGHCRDATADTTKSCSGAWKKRGAYRSCNYTTPEGLSVGFNSHQSSGGGFQTEFNSSAQFFSSDDVCRHENVSSVLVHLATANFSKEQGVAVRNGTFFPGSYEDFPLVWSGDSDEGRDCLLHFRSPMQNKSQPDATVEEFSLNPTDHHLIGAYLKGIFSSSSRDDFGRVLLNSSSIAGTVLNITTSMSYAIGNTNPAASTLLGEAITSEQFTHVSWPWIILPLSEILMGLMLLACTLVYSKQKDVASWKSSGLVPFLTQMEGWQPEELSLSSSYQVSQKTQRIYTTLEFDKGVVCLVKSTSGGNKAVQPGLRGASGCE